MFADEGNQHVRITLLSPRVKIKEAFSRMERFVKSL
jgi:aspartate/methionine/tyrosine aminotransferase